MTRKRYREIGVPKTDQRALMRGNKRAVLHGGYVSLDRGKLDRRSIEAKQLENIEARLADAVGGDPSPMEVLLIQNISVLALRCNRLGSAVAMQKDVGKHVELEKNFLRFANALRDHLRTLGLHRRTREKDISQWIAEVEASVSGTAEGGNDETV